MTHNLKRILIMAGCCTVISVMPAAADDLANYLTLTNASGPGNQVLTYAGDGSTFTNGDLQFTFTGLTITPTCTDTTTGATIACMYGSYDPTTAAQLNIQGTLGLNGYAGFDMTGEFEVDAYSYYNSTTQTTDTVDVKEDINLNYTVSTISQDPTINGAFLTVDGCVTDPGVQANGCVTTGNNLPPKLRVNESWQPANASIQVSAPPQNLAQSVAFGTSYNSLQVSKDIFLDSGTCTNCSASFSDLKQYYSELSQVPEPRAYAWVLGLGLLGLVQLRRRTASNA